MQNYKPGTDVPLTFDLVSDAGEILQPTALLWRILDEAETELQGWSNVAVPSTSEITLTIPALLTALTPPALRAIRTVELQVITADGTILLSDAALLQGITALAFGVNTFQTYTQALLLSEDSVSDQIPGWAASPRDIREKALIEAFQRILMMPIGMHFNDQQSMLQIDTTFVYNYGPNMLRYMTPAQMGALYTPLLVALRKAQLIEADDVLNPDPVLAARRSGMSSNIAGEASQFFRSSKPLDMPICDRAMKYLQRWVRFGAVISRT